LTYRQSVGVSKQSHCLCLPGRDEGANRLLASAQIGGEALSYVGGLKRTEVRSKDRALARLRISSFR